jgi:hypothetical protein
MLAPRAEIMGRVGFQFQKEANACTIVGVRTIDVVAIWTRRKVGVCSV